ncbi:MAG: ammonia-forming cytochrome c nitrite reductase subunit c552 [Lentilitoribacter sp.]
MIKRNHLLWFLWTLLSVVGITVIMGFVFFGGPRHLLLIGKTTAAHGQIELACESCHTTGLVDNLTKSPKKLAAAMTKACGTCHLEELSAANDSHPTKKFRGAKKAKTRAQLNAFYCQTCHAEHLPEITRPMAVSLPQDLCVACHSKIGEERESHVGLEFTTCASAGCHNYHDNSALYEAFLVKHGHGEDFLPHAIQEFAAVSRSPSIIRTALAKEDPVFALETYLNEKQIKTDDESDEPLNAETKAKLASQAQEMLDLVLYAKDVIAPAKYLDENAVHAWETSAHAASGLNCASCHAPELKDSIDLVALEENWTEKPGLQVCSDCHQDQATTFTQGKHGMRLHPELAAPRVVEADGPMSVAATFFKDAPLGPITVGESARKVLMKPDAHDMEIGSCNTCHKPHDVNLEVASVEACTTCHNDDHTQNYFNSTHFELWKLELAGEGVPGSGVTCADCHMPKVEAKEGFFTSHNQNDFLRPNEKMIRPVCMSCHGLGFSIDALADPKLVESNFNGRPSKHIESIDWALKREE